MGTKVDLRIFVTQLASIVSHTFLKYSVDAYVYMLGQRFRRPSYDLLHVLYIRNHKLFSFNDSISENKVSDKNKTA